MHHFVVSLFFLSFLACFFPLVPSSFPLYPLIPSLLSSLLRSITSIILLSFLPHCFINNNHCISALFFIPNCFPLFVLAFSSLFRFPFLPTSCGSSSSLVQFRVANFRTRGFCTGRRRKIKCLLFSTTVYIHPPSPFNSPFLPSFLHQLPPPFP